MAKAAKQKTKPANQSSVFWKGQLPSAYETLLVGFHAKLTTEELVKHFKLPPNVKPPKKIKDVKIGSFTPEMFDDPEFSDFWKTPVSAHMLMEHKAVFNALSDPHVAEVMEHTGYDMSICHPTLETLARMAQAQYIGFQIHMARMTSHNMHSRLENLRNPMMYYAMRTCDFVKRHKLENVLPKDPPHFEITKKEFSVKGVKSAMDKAYTRTGKPKSKREFLEDPDKFGVFGVNDLQRTTIKLTKSGDINPSIVEDKYLHVRNILMVGLMTGELGIVVSKENHGERTDSVLYPPTERKADGTTKTRIKDQMPVMMVKGDIYHAGPMGTYLAAPIEVQICVMPDYSMEETHKLYNSQRDIEALKAKTPKENKALHEKYDTMIKEFEELRIMHFEQSLPASFVEKRRAYMQDPRVPKDDPMFLVLEKNDMFGNSNATKKQAIQVAFNECPDPDLIGRKGIQPLDPFDARHKSPVLQKTLRDVIQYSPSPETSSVKYRASRGYNMN